MPILSPARAMSTLSFSARPRIPARKNPLIEAAIYRALIRPSIRRAFHRVAISAPYGEEWSGMSTIFYAHHVSWWDGYIACLLCDERWHIEGYLMMEEPQLRRYRFFQWCGCFSVDRHDPREGLRSVAYAADLLRQRRGRAVWIYPQGAIAPPERRPLNTYAGAAHVARRAAPVHCVPVALRFEFFGEQRPEALIRLGPSHVVEGGDAKALHAEMDERLLAEIEGLHADIISGAAANYHTILAGRPSVNVLWDRVRGKLPKP